MTQFRRCSRPGCGQPAVATLTYAYAQSTAFIGPLVSNNDPHSWDLCEHHAARITPPLGWELLRVDAVEEDEDLTALAEAVREGGVTQSGLVDDSDRRRFEKRTGLSAALDAADRLQRQKRPAEPVPQPPGLTRDDSEKSEKKPAKRDHREGYVPNHPIRRPAYKAARRAHLTVVPDMEDNDEE